MWTHMWDGTLMWMPYVSPIWPRCIQSFHLCFCRMESHWCKVKILKRKPKIRNANVFQKKIKKSKIIETKGQKFHHTNVISLFEKSVLDVVTNLRLSNHISAADTLQSRWRDEHIVVACLFSYFLDHWCQLIDHESNQSVRQTATTDGLWSTNSAQCQFKRHRQSLCPINNPMMSFATKTFLSRYWKPSRTITATIICVFGPWCNWIE